MLGGAVPAQTREVSCGGRYLSGDDTLRVFAAGSNYFVYGVDPAGGDPGHPRDARLVRFVRNMLDDMIRR